LRFGLLRNVRRAEAHDQDRRGPAADAVDRNIDRVFERDIEGDIERNLASAQPALRKSALECLGDQRCPSKRCERRRAAKIGLRALRCMHERVIRGECGDGLVAAGEEPMNALVERQIEAGALGRDHEDGRRVVGQHNMRAGAGQSAADAGAESAQAFKSRRSAGGQRGRQAGNLHGGRLAGGESPRADRCRC